MKDYRKYIQNWTHSEVIIASNLKNWYETFNSAGLDEKTGLPLFMQDTERSYKQALDRIPSITDVLPPHLLFEPVEPPSRLKSQLNTWIGARGVESKLEKFHHQLAHFANRGMRRSLTDALSISGMAIYNLRIRFRIRLLRDVNLRKDYPANQTSPSHLNHSIISMINRKARQAGLDCDVHEYVEILPEDNLERFMSQYWEEQKERNVRVTPSCTRQRMCNMCGSRIEINPNQLSSVASASHQGRKRKRKPQHNDQQ